MDGVAALDPGATANLVRFSRLAHHSSILEKHGFPKVTTYPSEARCRFGDGRPGEVRRAADIPAWNAGNKGSSLRLRWSVTVQRCDAKGPQWLLGGG